MTKLVFVGGPWSGEHRDTPTVIPSRVVKVFSEPDTELVCADEQVVEFVGRYWRQDHSADDGSYIYYWEYYED
jgi:hypothetical protein